MTTATQMTVTVEVPAVVREEAEASADNQDAFIREDNHFREVYVRAYVGAWVQNAINTQIRADERRERLMESIRADVRGRNA